MEAWTEARLTMESRYIDLQVLQSSRQMPIYRLVALLVVSSDRVHSATSTAFSSSLADIGVHNAEVRLPSPKQETY